tara:strand:+ start:26 stop:238 length:213 start_codon:yes stop_codon:yes gene_type:complete
VIGRGVKMRMNDQTKLVFALEHVAHLHDLIEDNEWESYLKSNLHTIEFELERQLSLLQYDRKKIKRKLND